MNGPVPYYKLYLREELARRCENNANYSMRSFARALDVDPAVLSRALADKRALSYKVANRVIGHLCLSPKEKEIFLESVAEDQKQRGLRKTIGEQSETEPSVLRQVSEVDVELFRIIGDWYHYAIQQQTLLDNFVSDARWIARRLGITVLEAKLAIQRLLSVGLISNDEGRLKATHVSIDTKDKSLSTPALRKYQKQLLLKAIYSLENDPFPSRSMSSMTMPIDPDKLPVARKLIQDFSSNLCEVLSSGKREGLYQLQISLFPLEKQDD